MCVSWARWHVERGLGDPHRGAETAGDVLLLASVVTERSNLLRREMRAEDGVLSSENGFCLTGNCSSGDRHPKAFVGCPCSVRQLTAKGIKKALELLGGWSIKPGALISCLSSVSR